MISQRSEAKTLSFLILVGAALSLLAACSSVPSAPKLADAAPTFTMKPIPNPAASEAPRAHPVVQAKAAPPRAKIVAARPTTPVNPVRAAQLRAAGLEAMDRGAIRHAVVLLQEASTLDPGNALIQRDLQRAVRISRLVG